MGVPYVGDRGLRLQPLSAHFFASQAVWQKPSLRLLAPTVRKALARNQCYGGRALPQDRKGQPDHTPRRSGHDLFVQRKGRCQRGTSSVAQRWIRTPGRCSKVCWPGLRALLNAGFERRAVVPRCVGPQFTLTEFRVFCPKALAGIGSLPDTISDRSVSIKMERRARGQTIEKFRMRDAEPIAQPIRTALEAWSQDQSTIQFLHAARPEIPNELGDRAADICEPLIAIADMAGGLWPSMARSALVELCSQGASEESTGVQLLGAIREIFTQEGKDKISTEDLLHALVRRDNGEPWAHFWEKDLKAGNTRGPATRVARYLKTFDIVSWTIRDADGNTPKGYKLESFQDAFSRYLPS
jgi:hypothetical protein